MLRQHQYYVYHDGDNVMARMGDREPVVMEACSSPQEAHDRVQAILNPDGRSHLAFGERGFLEPAFQDAIAANSEAAVRAAYGEDGRQDGR